MRVPDPVELQLTVPPEARAGRADKLLAALHPELSRSRWQKLFQEGRVWTEDRILSQKDKLYPGDMVQYTLPPPEPLDLRPVAMDLDVLYQDADILVLNKAAGLVVHPGAGTAEDTLVHGLLHHCAGRLPGIGGAERPGIVHRLDKETSGVMVVALTDRALASLAAQFAEREVKKHYIALVAGSPAPAEGLVDAAIGRHPTHRTRMACRADGRPARTAYRVEERFGGAAARVALRIHTGRTHQIRVHMQQLGHPLLGDRLYGFRETLLPAPSGCDPLAIPRVMLHAARLEIRHPADRRTLAFEAPAPGDIAGVIAALRARYTDGNSH
jgi:23S rRNA pseudouridine1911/1915/1917 synthase